LSSGEITFRFWRLRWIVLKLLILRHCATEGWQQMDEMITVSRAREMVAKIASQSSDDETAHRLERKLRDQVLTAIAQGSTDSLELAEIALSTNDVGFSRWFG
jgi:hypothetical protein